MTEQTKKTIGRAENVVFPELGDTVIPARIDTGARMSVLWAGQIRRAGQRLEVVLFAPSSPNYSGVVLTFTEFDSTVVSSSMGQTQQRYMVRLLVKIKGKKIRAWFMLADRSSQVYPVLIGRNVLAGKFIVDVKKGRPLREAEHQRYEALQSQLNKTDEEEKTT